MAAVAKPIKLSKSADYVIEVRRKEDNALKGYIGGGSGGGTFITGLDRATVTKGEYVPLHIKQAEKLGWGFYDKFVPVKRWSIVETPKQNPNTFFDTKKEATEQAKMLRKAGYTATITQMGQRGGYGIYKRGNSFIVETDAPGDVLHVLAAFMGQVHKPDFEWMSRQWPEAYAKIEPLFKKQNPHKPTDKPYGPLNKRPRFKHVPASHKPSPWPAMTDTQRDALNQRYREIVSEIGPGPHTRAEQVAAWEEAAMDVLGVRVKLENPMPVVELSDRIHRMGVQDALAGDTKPSAARFRKHYSLLTMFGEKSDLVEAAMRRRYAEGIEEGKRQLMQLKQNPYDASGKYIRPAEPRKTVGEAYEAGKQLVTYGEWRAVVPTAIQSKVQAALAQIGKKRGKKRTDFGDVFRNWLFDSSYFDWNQHHMPGIRYSDSEEDGLLRAFANGALENMQRENPGKGTGKFAHCVDAVAAKGGAYDPAAVCAAMERRAGYMNPIDRRKVSPGKLASDYKARGIDRQRAWSQFVIDRDLSPGIDAKDFYRYYDMAEPKLLVDEVEEKQKTREAYVDPELADYGRRVRVTIKIGRQEEVREGTIYRTLHGSDGSPVYEVDFGDGPQRLRSKDTVEFLNPIGKQSDKDALMWEVLRRKYGKGKENPPTPAFVTHDLQRFDKLAPVVHYTRTDEKGVTIAVVEWTENTKDLPYKFDLRVYDKAGNYRRSLGFDSADAAVDYVAGMEGWGRNPKSNRRGKRNPEDAAADLFREFHHGIEPTEVVEIHENIHIHENLTGLGPLVELKVKLTNGGRSVLAAPDINDPDKRVLTSSNEAGTQIYFSGGDQSIDLKKLGFSEAQRKKELVTVGQIHELTYHAARKGQNKNKTLDWFHHLSEETKEPLPNLIYDTVNEKMMVSGGAYRISDYIYN